MLFTKNTPSPRREEASKFAARSSCFVRLFSRGLAPEEWVGGTCKQAEEQSQSDGETGRKINKSRILY
jgi:hypothetical protein